MFNMDKTCRTCMKQDVTFINLYETVAIEENCFQLADLLVQCTTAEVSKDDDLPQNLCEDCVNALKISYTFRTQTSKAQEQFKLLLQSYVKAEPPDLQPKTEFNEYIEDWDFPDDTKVFEDTDFLCEQCNECFTNKERFLKHLKSHKTKSFHCKLCKEVFTTELMLNKHIAQHICCNVDSNTLQEPSDLNDGEFVIKAENDELKLTCAECGQSFLSRRSLANHTKKHKPKVKDKQFICDTCGRVFKGKQPLKRHLETHNKNKRHRCSKCPRTFTRKDQLKVHLRGHNEKKPYSCSYCNKGFTQLCNLKDHIRCHTGETPFLCSECGKAFSCNSNLRQHMMRHTGVKPFACNLCPKTFCTKGQMVSHVVTHSGVHPFTCVECGATFTKSSSLKKHSLIHLGVRPFACETCNQRFTSKDHLKRHNRIHTGEKPYQCKYCERAFAQSNDLVKHTRSHVGQNIYQCTICSTRFRLKSELTQHYPIHFLNGEYKKENPLPQQDTNTEEIPKPMKTDTQNYLLDIKPNDSLNKIDFPLILNDDKEFRLQESFQAIPENENNRITITINSCNEDGVVNGITINLAGQET